MVPWTAAHQVSLSFTISRSLLKLMSIDSMMPSNHLILCCPLSLLPSIFPGFSVFSNVLALRIRWSTYWSFSFSVSPSNDYSVLIYFRIDWFDLLAVQRTLMSFLEHHRSNSILRNLSNGYFMLAICVLARKQFSELQYISIKSSGRRKMV